MIDHDIDWALRWKSAYIPPKFRGLTLDDWPPQSASGQAALTAARHFVATLPQRRRTPRPDTPRHDRALIGVGMSILGPNGTGKTDLSCAILTEAHMRWGMVICYARTADYVTACVQRANPPKDEEEKADPAGAYQHALRFCTRVETASLTVFGDLGKERKTATGFPQQTINNTLRARYESARPSLITSNEPHAKWAVYDAALPSFAAEAVPPILLVGADLRVR